MPQKNIYERIEAFGKLLYPTRADSIKAAGGLDSYYLDKLRRGEATKEDTLYLQETGLLTKPRTLTAAEEARGRLVDTGLMTQARADSVTGGLLKFATPREPSEEEIGIRGLELAGEITPAQADSMRSGLDIGTGLERKFGATPWYLSDEWIDTEEGRAALEKSLRGQGVKEQLAFWTGIQKDATGSFTEEPINQKLFDRAKREIDNLLAKEIPAEYEVEGKPEGYKGGLMYGGLKLETPKFGLSVPAKRPKVGPLIQKERPAEKKLTPEEEAAIILRQRGYRLEGGQWVK